MSSILNHRPFSIVIVFHVRDIFHCRKHFLLLETFALVGDICHRWKHLASLETLAIVRDISRCLRHFHCQKHFASSETFQVVEIAISHRCHNFESLSNFATVITILHRYTALRPEISPSAREQRFVVSCTALRPESNTSAREQLFVVSCTALRPENGPSAREQRFVVSICGGRCEMRRKMRDEAEDAR